MSAVIPSIRELLEARVAMLLRRQQRMVEARNELDDDCAASDCATDHKSRRDTGGSTCWRLRRCVNARYDATSDELFSIQDKLDGDS